MTYFAVYAWIMFMHCICLLSDIITAFNTESYCFVLLHSFAGKTQHQAAAFQEMPHTVGKKTGQVYCLQWRVFWRGLSVFCLKLNKSSFLKKVPFLYCQQGRFRAFRPAGDIKFRALWSVRDGKGLTKMHIPWLNTRWKNGRSEQ
jgi:hypothetical protein